MLEEVLEAHGGAERWARARTIQASVRSGGLLPRTRMPGNRLGDYRLTVDVVRPWAMLDPFPRAGRRGVFDRGDARIETTSGEVVESRADPRAAFSGLSGLRRNLRWDALDSVYFAGYAMWNYLTTPHLLTREGVAVVEGEPWDEDGEAWRRLEVDFPPDLDTHSRHQTFYFDSTGLLRRHDYRAEVVGAWADAAHLCAGHIERDGLVFPTSRRVRPRGPANRVISAPTLVRIDIDDLSVDTQ
ncbi:MAG: hypothetical protein ACRDK1_09045 [Solirubrobacterales bacterium]